MSEPATGCSRVALGPADANQVGLRFQGLPLESLLEGQGSVLSTRLPPDLVVSCDRFKHELRSMSITRSQLLGLSLLRNFLTSYAETEHDSTEPLAIREYVTCTADTSILVRLWPRL